MKKKSKYHTRLKVNASFDEVLELAVKGNPKPKKKKAKK